MKPTQQTFHGAWLLLPFLGALSACAPGLSDTTDDVHRQVNERIYEQVDWRVREFSDDAYRAWLRDKLSGELDIDTTVIVSLLNNRRLRALYGELGVSRADLIDAGLPNNPIFSFERRFRGQSMEFDVAQDFLSIFLIPLRRKTAAAELEATKARVAEEILNHVFEVRSAYYNAQAAAQLLEMRRTVSISSDAALEAARRLREAGNIPQLDLLQESNAANDARLELARAEQEIIASRERLNVLLGLESQLSSWKPATRLPLPPASSSSSAALEELALKSRLDLARAEAAVRAAASRADVTDVESRLNELVLSSHWEREPEGEDSTGPSIEVALPIFNWGNGARARAAAELLQAENSYAALAVEIRSEVRTAYAVMKAAESAAENFRRNILPVQQNILDETQRLYNGMFIGVFQLLQARQLQISAGKDFIESLRDYWLARTALEKALGRSLPKAVTKEMIISVESEAKEHHHHH